ncbi:MAG: hypothetical protein GY822_24420 [Deltaproteobacteria bacterium]|nr:hypothetical protein [Deltaproteobacteria bacterium]
MKNTTFSFSPLARTLDRKAFASRVACIGFGAVLLLSAGIGCTPSSALCERKKECASDPPGEDFVQICTISNDGRLRSLRANSEEECQELADAKVAFDACRAALECTDFNEGDLNDRCEDELDDYQDALGDADNECSALD